jgi:serine/threonine protein kinase
MRSSSQSLPVTRAQQSFAAMILPELEKAVGARNLHTVVATALEAMRDAWQAGNLRPAEELLAECPALKDDAEAAVRVIYEEFCLREERGERVEAEEYYQRFPQWREALGLVLDCHELLRDDFGQPTFPVEGSTLGELHLLRELGRGALGRVFLAKQQSLSDRLLAVKLTPRRGQEHLSLARLQHTHIVPLYSVQDFPNENLRAICMPYLGGMSWGDILNRLQTTPVALRTGKHITRCLLNAAKEAPELTVGAAPALSFVSRATYNDAVCWIGACLADALHDAHQRGLAHLDIKPSNVLMTAEGQPMLLDFHIASDLKNLQKETFERIGGTPVYMSPEQREAADAVRRGAAIARPVDARSDIYSLGILLYESLAGQIPATNLALLRRKLRLANPAVSRGLEDILCRCLSSAPDDRYETAAQLAADLRCHLASLPLQTVGNHSLIERWRKWRRRKPFAMPMLAVSVAAAILVLGVGTTFFRNHGQAAETALTESQRALAEGNYAGAIQNARAGWDAVQLVPWRSDLKGKLKEQLTKAEHAQARAALHDLVDKLQFVENHPPNDARLSEIAKQCNQIWQLRDSFLKWTVNDEQQRSGGKLDSALRRDLIDLAILSARLDVQIAGVDKSEAVAQVHRKFAEARQICGPSEWLDLEERDSSAGVDFAAMDPSQLPTAYSAWDHYALGRWLMHREKFDVAEREFAKAIELDPASFWANFQAARCQFNLKQYDRALTSASVCVALSPKQPECYYNRALCQEALHHDVEAQSDFRLAGELNVSAQTN